MYLAHVYRPQPLVSVTVCWIGSCVVWRRAVFAWEYGGPLPGATGNHFSGLGANTLDKGRLSHPLLVCALPPTIVAPTAMLVFCHLRLLHPLPCECSATYDCCTHCCVCSATYDCRTHCCVYALPPTNVPPTTLCVRCHLQISHPLLCVVYAVT